MSFDVDNGVTYAVINFFRYRLEFLCVLTYAPEV